MHTKRLAAQYNAGHTSVKNLLADKHVNTGGYSKSVFGKCVSALILAWNLMLPDRGKGEKGKEWVSEWQVYRVVTARQDQHAPLAEWWHRHIGNIGTRMWLVN